jgi:HEPN domain-containing protein
MRREIDNWLKQAEYDFETAKYNFDGGRYSTAAFLVQQAVEKALKAYFLFRNKKPPETTHSLIYLAKETGVPALHYRFLKELTPEFIMSRYPDASGELPYQIYDKGLLEDYLKKSEEVLNWIRSQMLK